MVGEFIDVFPNDIPSILSNNDIEFGIDIESGTQPTFILSYQITPPELKELNE